jgi:hypothetical protein
MPLSNGCLFPVGGLPKKWLDLDGSVLQYDRQGSLMGLKGFETGSERKREREVVEVDLGLEVVLCTAGVAVQARGLGCVE